MNSRNVIEIIKDIERYYEVETITSFNIKIWPLLKLVLCSNLTYSGSKDEKIKRNLLSKLAKRASLIRPICYGINNFFSKKYEYILFTDTLEKRIVNGMYIDKVSQGLIDLLSNEQFLVIENPVNNFHYPIKTCKSEHISSLRLIQLSAILLYLLNCGTRSLNITNEKLIKTILAEGKIALNYKALIKQFFGYVKIFETLFKRIKPKLIFINCYYSVPHMSAIYAAKRNKIKIVELQHGIINDKHWAYNYSKDFGTNFFPDYLFVFGEFFKKFFKDGNYFIEKDNVFSVGSYYIELINVEKSSDLIRKVISLKAKYEKTIVVSSQVTVENELFDFMLRVARDDKVNLYIFRPRILNKHYIIDNVPGNFYLSIDEAEDIYRLLKVADIHATVYSTVCLEALAFGVPNIMVNLNNLARLYFGEILDETLYTIFVNNVSDFINAVRSWGITDRKAVMKKGEYFFDSNHGMKLGKAISEIVNN
mgnify:FL=1